MNSTIVIGLAVLAYFLLRKPAPSTHVSITDTFVPDWNGKANSPWADGAASSTATPTNYVMQ